MAAPARRKSRAAAAAKPTASKKKIECPECHAISRPPAVVDKHEEGCSRSIAAQAEREGRGFFTATVDGADAVVYQGKTIPLLSLTTDELIGIVSTMKIREAKAEKDHKKTGDTLSKARKDVEAAVDRLVERHRNEHGQTRMEGV